MLLVAAACSVPLAAQTEASTTTGRSWDFNASLSGYLIEDGQSYVSPTFSGDRGALHLEARYNYEAQQTGSLWAGYNLKAGKELVLEATPMIGGVFGRVDGVAPGLEFTLTYKKLQLYSANEYILSTNSKADNFFYTWTQATYSPTAWFSIGYVTQRTRAYRSPLAIQRGPLLGFSHKKWNFTTAVFNIGETDPIVDFSLGFSF
jgi:hypothetical protein